MIDRRNIANLYPLSPLQEGMLFHALREPQSRAYFEQLDFELPASVDSSAYLQAWAALLRRHDALRTTFAVRGLQQPLQVVLREAGVVPRYEDLRASTLAEAEARVAEWRGQDLAQGLEPTVGVPMRLALFTLPQGLHRVVWSFHHILLDGWSLAILQDELEALYQAQQGGKVAVLSPPAPYSAYIRWLGQQDAEAGRSYWRDRLAHLEHPTPLPRLLSAQFGPVVSAPDRDECVHPLSDTADKALLRLAARHGVTHSLVVQSLWGLLLGRHNGCRDAAFLATVSGRPPQLPHSERTVGLFINAIPVRVRCEPGETYAALLARLRDNWLSAQDWQHCPLADVQAAHPLGQRLFDHIMVFENYPQATAGDAHQQARTVHLHEHTHYAFEFQFLPGAAPSDVASAGHSASRLRLRFDPALYDARAVASWAREVDRLLCQAEADPDIHTEALLGLREQPGPTRVVLVASFTADPLVEAASQWLSQMQSAVHWQLAPYNQCVQQLSDPHSALRQAELGLLLLRWSDAVRDLRAVSEAEALQRLNAQFETLLQLLAQSALPPLIVVLLPEPPPRDALEVHVAQWLPRWRERLAGLSGLTLIDLRTLPLLGDAWLVFDPVADELAHLPYTEAACEVLGEALARAVHARKRLPFKVLAIDCDNTLWEGVVGEVGPLGVQVTPAHQALQDALIDWQSRGFLLVLASKNVAQDVWAVFDQHPDMRLRREHIADAAINWQPKSDNLRHLAQRLNLGLDSVIFLDDSPVECAEVMRNAPQVLALPLPAQVAARPAWLQAVWAFDQVHVSAEDRERTRRMQEEGRRQAALADQPLDTLLALLALRIDVGRVQPHQQARVAQLTQRTNQFNLSGLRRSEDDIRALCNQADMQVLAVEVADRFGDYGLTGVAIMRQTGTTDDAEIDTFILSCRVLGRGVEQVVLSALARRAQALGLRRIVARCVPTERNEPVRQFLAQAPWQPAEPLWFVCEVDAVIEAPTAMTIAHDCVFAPPYEEPPIAQAWTALGPPPASAAADAQVPADALVDALRWPEFFPMDLVNEAALQHGRHYLPLLARCAGWPGRVRLVQGSARRLTGAGRGRLPAGEREQQIAQLWSEVLGVDVQDAQAHFADLGGHSLHAVRVVARMQHAHGVALSLQTFLSHDSVEALAHWWTAQAVALIVVPTALPHPPETAASADHPLSFNQQRLWLLREVGADEAVHTLCAAFRLQGPLDRSALQQAVDALVQRHDALRTAIALVGDQPRQRLLPATPGQLTLHEPVLDETALRARIIRRARQPFDLAHGPLFEATLFRVVDGSAVLALFMHHIVSDGWSFDVLLRDLSALYAQALGQGPAPPAASVWHHVDYAAWSRSDAGAAERLAAQHYWRERLQTLPDIARLAPDPVVGVMSRAEGGRSTRVLPVALEALQAWCARRQVHLLSLLASITAVLLHRCGGGLPVRLGTPLAGRTRPEFESVVGFFANTVPLCIAPDETEAFADLLQRLQQRVEEAVQHQSYPFDRMVADARPERDPLRHPLFDVMVVLQNARETQAGLAGLQVSDVDLDPGLCEFDLTFEFGAAADGRLACRLTWRQALYLPQTAEALLGRVVTLLMAVLHDPACHLSKLPLLPAAEQSRLRVLTQGPKRPIPELDLGRLVAQQAALHGARLAVCDARTALDYRGLDAAANAFAQQIHIALHGRQGAVVAVMLERSVEWAVALLGVLKAGAVYLPLERRHPRARLQSLVQRSQAALLVAPPTEAVLAPGLTWLAPPQRTARADTPPPVQPQGLDLAYLIFTSGSTGEPKGVRVPHRAFINMALAQVQGFGITPTDVVLQMASCAFDASLSELFMAWLAGASVVVASDEWVRDGDLLAQAIRRHGATVATFTPSHLRQLDDEQLRGLRTVVLAAEPVLGHDVRRLLAQGLAVFNAYGPTETAVCATLGAVTVAPPAGAAVPIGRPLAQLRVRVVDAQCRDQPLGVAGEVVVEGEGVAMGYLAAADDAVQASFQTTDDGLRRYCTGDVGRWRVDDALEILGRADGQVKIRGHRVDAAEVVSAFCTIPGVRQAEVLAIEGPSGTTLCAFLCGEAQADGPLRARLAERLAPYMLPARMVWLDRMPLNSSGKIDHATLRQRLELLSPPAATTSGDVEALDPLAAALLPLWRECLPGLIDADTDFFAAGGDSVTAMQLARRISRELGRRCGAAQCFRTPTVRGMAAVLAAPDPSPVAALAETWGHGTLLIIALPPYPGLELGWHALSRHWPEARLQALSFVDMTVDTLLQRYEDEARRLGAGQSWVLLGYSGGGQMALALARRLQHTPHAPSAVLLLDTWNLQQVYAADRQRLVSALTLDPATGSEPQSDMLGTAYLRCLEALQPKLTVATMPLKLPVCHVLAGEFTAPPPTGAHRHWSRLCERVWERTVPGTHAQLLDTAHVDATVAAMRALLADAGLPELGGNP